MATAVAYTWDSQRQGREIFPTWQIVIEKDRRVIFYFHLTQSGHYKEVGTVTKSLTSWNSCLLVDVLESLILAPQAEHRKSNADHIRFVRSVSLAYQSWDGLLHLFNISQTRALDLKVVGEAEIAISSLWDQFLNCNLYSKAMVNFP